MHSSRRRSTACLSGILISIFLTINLGAQQVNEILCRPENRSMSVSILSRQPAEVFWEYGLTSDNLSFRTETISLAAEIPAVYTFSNLQPDTRYHYRRNSRQTGDTGAFIPGPVRSFHTQRSAGSGFTFTVEADEHLYDKKGVRSIYRICLENQAADQPDFLLSLGDTYGDDHTPETTSAADMDLLHNDYRPYLGEICHSVPFLFCLGNHEGESSYWLGRNPPDNIGVYGTLSRKKYFPNPVPGAFYSGNSENEPWGIGNPENYYAFTWGDALFVVLDVYRYQSSSSAKPGKWDWSLGYAQYTWLRSTLENSRSRYKFVFAHHTLGQGRGGAATARFHEWGGFEQDGVTWGFDRYRPGWGKPIHQLFVDNKVDIFFQGHDHLFAREVLDGVVYQEVPMPSDSTYEIGILANAGAYLSDTRGGTGHLRVTVAPEDVRVDFVRAYLPADTGSLKHNRETAFSYSLRNGVMNTPVIPEEREIVRIYPNPAKDTVRIQVGELTSGLTVTLLSRSGQPLMESTSSEISVAGIPDGVYILQITKGGKSFKRKLMVIH